MTTATSMKEAVAQANAQFVERMNGGDIPGACEVYTENARILPPGADMVVGKSAIAEFWAGAIEAFGVKTVSLETVVVEQLSEDTAREIGRYKLDGADGPLDHGKFVVLWQQGSDGNWHWDWDIWNSSQG